MCPRLDVMYLMSIERDEHVGKSELMYVTSSERDKI